MHGGLFIGPVPARPPAGIGDNDFRYSAGGPHTHEGLFRAFIDSGIFSHSGLFTMAFSINPSPACLFEFSLDGFKIGVTPAGLEMAAQTFCRSAGAVSCLCFLILTTPVTQVFSLLDRVPFPSLLLEVMILVYGSIMVLLDTAGKMVLSQSSRLGYSSARASYRSLSWLVAKLFVHSLRRSREMYLGLASRGYEDRIRVVQPDNPPSPLYLTFAATSGFFLIYLALRTGGLSS
jgi:cobalt/nickel transport system permease protein